MEGAPDSGSSTFTATERPLRRSSGSDLGAVRVLMLGWEFPPYFAGGVGVVCEAMTRALARHGTEVTYLMPRSPARGSEPGVRVLSIDAPGAAIELVELPSVLVSYATTPGTRTISVPGEPRASSPDPAPLYGPNLLEEVDRFADAAARFVREHGLAFDLIHAHDWTTFRAGVALKALTGRPLAVHVHITEFDKSGGQHADSRVWALEHEGMTRADRVIAVSRRIAERCIASYGVDPARLRVVYNAVDPDRRDVAPVPVGERMVLFLGRITLQKGPEYFVEAARRVLEKEPDVVFVMAGQGDMLPRMIERAAELGLGRRMLFPGFVDRDRAAALYESADVFVMPSVSEPFGIVPLEAMDRGVPVIVSRQSGAGELLSNVLKVDFWDVDDLASKIASALRYPTLARELRERGKEEVGRISWDGVADRLEHLYREMLHA
jgi:glycosyltransferase involved in cell wall biosynthesis